MTARIIFGAKPPKNWRQHARMSRDEEFQAFRETLPLCNGSMLVALENRRKIERFWNCRHPDMKLEHVYPEAEELERAMAEAREIRLKEKED